MNRLMRTSAGLLAAAALLAGAPLITSAAGDDVAALKAQVIALQQKVADLEAKQAGSPVAVTQGPLTTLKARPVYLSPVYDDDWADPFAMMDAMQQQMQALTGRMSMGAGTGIGSHGFNLDYDIKENDKAYIFTFDVPGMDKSKINVEVKPGALMISGERSSEEKDDQTVSGNKVYRQQRSFGYFSRVIPLPTDAKGDKVDAKYDNGVLTVTVDKKENSGRPANAARKIEVK